MKIPKTNLKPEELIRLKEIADEKSFPESTFNSLCKAYAKLNDSQKSLYIDLLKRFLYIPFYKYPEELAVATDKFIQKCKTHKIYIYNGFSNKDYGKVKSNYLVSYQFRAIGLKSRVNFAGREVKVLHSIKELLQIDDDEKCILVLVDDFVGSGDTMEKAFSYIHHRLKIHNKSIKQFAVICLVAMKSAVARLWKSKIPIYCSHILEKGISDYYEGEDLERAIVIMKEMERQNHISEYNSFGYGKSEALVCMERCPNNTFPIFRYGRNAIFKR